MRNKPCIWVLILDPDDVWGNGKNTNVEVKYLLQSQKKEWPNYAGRFVSGPGIGSIVKLPDGYCLIFAARRAGSDAQHGHERYAWKVPVEIDISDQKPPDTWMRVLLPE